MIYVAKLKYYLKRLIGLWPPSRESAERMIYDLKDADEDYKGRR